ncbi:MAG: hypothetical protein LC122_14790 [Chitinophagales bacterium]|nr:hypothetical protein [Chitinophagales bacterium]
MRRYNGTEFLFGIILTLLGSIYVIGLLNEGISIIMKSFGFQFKDSHTGFYFIGLFIIIVVLFFIYFDKLKEYIFLCIDVIFNKKHSETLLKNLKNELQTQTTNYQKLKNGIDEIDKIL